MTNDYEIGRVVAVDTANVTIELKRDLKALTRSTYEGTTEVGSINSYIIIPVGSRRIVAIVTRIVLTEESEPLKDKTKVALPLSRRLMNATMIGTIDENEFKQGINLFPVLDSPVLITKREDLDAIFGKISHNENDSDEPGYCISVGRSAFFLDYDIKINPDTFFGKHAAIIGSTGSGKSCSIATILQSIIEHPKVKQTRFVILDTNGEYRSAFQKKEGGKWSNAKPAFKSLYIPTDPNKDEKLAIPYWFMDSDDFVRLFRASPGVQKPVLLNALSSARNDSSSRPAWIQLREKLIREFHNVLSCSSGHEGKNAREVNELCCGLEEYLKLSSNKEAIDEICEQYPDFKIKDLKKTMNGIVNIVKKGIRNEGNQFESYRVLDINKKTQIEELINPLISTLSRLPKSDLLQSTSIADCPSHFSIMDFRYRHIEEAMTRDYGSLARVRENCSTMLMRIFRLLEDSRFEFLFGPSTNEWPDVKHSLATFLRDLLGLESIHKCRLSNTDILQEKSLPFYERQRKGVGQSNVVIIDLSLLASEVLENVTALIGRLIHEFMQRLSFPESDIERGEFPVVLILEEAQNYIPEGNKNDEESISKQVFERIAREGRKYGLGLVVASQRPSEMSKTVLSQCNSFIVHRLQNPEDLRYFREIVPSIYGKLLEQLPALAPRSALVLGECVPAPALVVMREVDPAPYSKNPQFFKSWTTEVKTPDIEKVCAKWENQGKQE